MEPFSHSRLGLFEKCPRAYRFKYIDCEREKFDTIEAHMGSSVHKALEWAYSRRETSAPSIKEVVMTYRDQFFGRPEDEVVVVKRGRTRDSYYLEGEEMLNHFLRHTFVDDRSETIALEKKFSLSLGSGLYYRGVIDRVAREESRSHLINTTCTLYEVYNDYGWTLPTSNGTS